VWCVCVCWVCGVCVLGVWCVCVGGCVVCMCVCVCVVQMSKNVTCALPARHANNKQHCSNVTKGDVIFWEYSAPDSPKCDKMKLKRNLVQRLEVKGCKSEWDNGITPPILYKECTAGKETNKEERKCDTVHAHLTVVWKPWSVVFLFIVCYSADQQSALLQAVYVRHIRIHCAQSGSFPRQPFFSAGFINLYLLLHHLYLTYTFHTQPRLSPHLRSSENFTQRRTVNQLRDLRNLFKCVPTGGGGGFSPGHPALCLRLPPPSPPWGVF